MKETLGLVTDPRVIRVVIPARFGSTRLPGKPLIDLAGTPMIVRVYEIVRRALPTLEIVVATDDDRIGAVLDAYDICCLMTGREHVSGTDRTAEVARIMGWNEQDIVINVQGDEPFLPPTLLRAFIDHCAQIDNIQMATVASPISDGAQLTDPSVVKLVTCQKQRALYFSRLGIPFDRDNHAARRTGDSPFEGYLRHIGVYAYRNAVLQRLTATAPCDVEEIEQLEQLRALWVGVPVHVMHWPAEVPGGVDTTEDVERAVDLIKNRSQ